MEILKKTNSSMMTPNLNAVDVVELSKKVGLPQKKVTLLQKKVRLLSKKVGSLQKKVMLLTKKVGEH